MILNNTCSMIANKILQLSVVKKCVRFCKNVMHKIQFQITLQKMDFEWQYYGRQCWQLFPPSFYYTHTKEEIQSIVAELKEKIENS